MMTSDCFISLLNKYRILCPLRIVCRLAFIFLLHGLPNPCFANDAAKIIKQARPLIAAKKIQQAYELLSPVADNYIGNAEFDYLYGSVLLELNHNTLATLTLERAAIRRPQHLATQMALFEAYKKLKNFDSARLVLEKIKKHPRSNIDSSEQIDDMEVKHTELYRLSGFLGAAVGYDDNLTNGPDDNFMELPVVSFLGPLYVGDQYRSARLFHCNDFRYIIRS